ncbi:MAG: nuclear transport factor 2 family protein [Candidatus Acidiferrales bacterium]
MNDSTRATVRRPIRVALAFAFVLIALLCVNASVPPALRADAASDEVLLAEQARTTALIAGDFAALDKLMADDVTYVHASGQRDTKETYLGALRSGVLSYQSWQAREIHVRMLGSDVAVLNGIYSVHAMDHRVSKDEIIIDLHFLTVYARRDGRWQQVAWQSTRVPVPVPAAAQ